MRSLTIALTAVSLLTMNGCATIMHGSQQDVGISSTPSNARVSVDNKPLGNTPVVANLKSGDTHFVKIELDGFLPFETTLTKRVTGWVWGNIVFGGVLGLAVDAMTGSLYRLTPDQVSAQLARQGLAGTMSRDGLFVVLVPAADASWEKVGEMVRE